MRKIPNEELDRIRPDEYTNVKKIPITVVLDNVRSLHNIGSIFRTGDGFRIEKVILCGISQPPPHRDIHKTALGAELVVPSEYFDNSVDAIHKLKKQGYYIFTVEQVEQSTQLTDLTLSGKLPAALVFGHEVRGVSQEVVNLSDECIEIPQFGTKHSFNVSVAAGIVLWEVSNRLSALPE